MRNRRLATGLALLLLTSPAVAAGPLLCLPPPPLAVQVLRSDISLLVQWDRDIEPDAVNFGTTFFRVVAVGRDTTARLAPRDQIAFPYRGEDQPGQFHLLRGKVAGGRIEWEKLEPFSATAFLYAIEAPGPDRPWGERIPYLLRHLEHADKAIADDAFRVLSEAPFIELFARRQLLSRHRLRECAEMADTPPERRGFYLQLLGLCGNPEDERMLAEFVFAPRIEFAPGVEGAVAGYLMLTGTAGLERLEESRLYAKHLVDHSGQPVLDDDGKPEWVPFPEVYAGMQALHFVWSYGTDVIPRDRVERSMRGLLDRPDLTDLVIANLARWHDWSVIDRTMELYERDDVAANKRAVIRYLHAAIRDVEDPEHPGPHVATARARLEELRKKDRAFVAETETFLKLLLDQR